jgi:uncharacterized protein (TIGR03435 family)
MKNIIILLLSCLFLLLPVGCSKDKQSDNEAPPEPGKELSTVPGVSIRRRPASFIYNSTRTGSGRSDTFEAKDSLLFDIVYHCCPFEGIFRNDAPLPNGRYDVTVQTPAEDQPSWPLLKEAIEKAFKVRFRQVNQLEDVYILVRQKGKSVTMSPADPKASSGYGTEQTSGGFGYRFRNSSMDKLAGVLEKYAETIVFNETEIKGGFDFDLAMDHWEPKTAFAGVEKLGLMLVKEKRKMDVLRIEKATEKHEHE